MLKRRDYAERVQAKSGESTVKILTGMKRAGKTSVFQMLQDDIAARGVAKKNIVYLSFDGMENAAIDDYQALYDAVAARAVPDERIFVFLDEIQRVHGWEKAALHLLHDVDAELYVAGSNAQITDVNVLAVLDGRYEIIEILPLSFSEFLSFRDSTGEAEDLSRELARFLMIGGFPALHAHPHTQSEAYAYIRDVLNAALWTDFVALTQLRRADQLERVLRFVFENVGRNFSAKHMSDSLRGEKREINIETVYSYLENLEKCYIISRCRRYDLVADEPLKTQEKFYLADPAMRYALLGFKPGTVASGLENAVYLELKRRGWDVYMGKLGRREIDFVAIRGQSRIYIQLGRELRGEADNADFSRLSAIRDSYPKFILTTDHNAVGNRGGIRTVPIAEFLAGKIDD
ncbi:MAG: ATP-binding protein [Oscillospiraceae bacterium]|jgi:predicted AAA+ superfamily ATPase|nr:ATP-binding protein [Oscillospiraceae bacterium]